MVPGNITTIKMQRTQTTTKRIRIKTQGVAQVTTETEALEKTQYITATGKMRQKLYPKKNA